MRLTADVILVSIAAAHQQISHYSAVLSSVTLLQMSALHCSLCALACVRITSYARAERARASLNALRERELDLRGYKIPVIENMGVTKDQFDTVDFSDNEIRKIGA
eukprot:7842-Heterococcus_DN1.PRE.3